MIEIRDMTIGDLVEFLQIARKEDLEEVKDISSNSILEEPISKLTGAKVLIHKETGEMLGIGAVVLEYPEEFRAGILAPWVLLTKNVYKHPVEFLRFSKRYLKELLNIAPVVVNSVSARNTLHVNWLEWMGCKWIEDAPTKAKGLKVFLFERSD